MLAALLATDMICVCSGLVDAVIQRAESLPAN
jgi:hypothetical protein